MGRVVSVKTVIASAAYENSASGIVDVSMYDEVTFVLDVASKEGSPTSLDVALQGSADGNDFGAFKTAQAFTQVTDVAARHIECFPLTNTGGWIKVNAVMVGGSAGNGYTFGVKAVCKMLQ